MKQKKKIIIAICIVLLLGICTYLFPVYRLAQVWYLDYYTTGEVSKLLYIGSNEDRKIAKGFVAEAEKAFEDLSTPSNKLEEKYGLFSRYATSMEMGGASEEHTLKLWSADFEGSATDSYGYVWVYYSYEVYDEKGDLASGSWKVPALWIFEKDEAGSWKLIYVKEHP